MKPRQPALVVLLTMLLTGVGCANWASGIGPEDTIDPTKAYIYGRFAMDGHKAFLGFDGHQTMGLVFDCGSHEFTIRLNNEDPVRMIPVRPGTCSLTEIVCTDVDGFVKTTLPWDRDYLHKIEFRAGAAIYVGDFHGSSEFYSDYGGTEQTWQIEKIESRFEETSQEVFRLLPAAAGLERVDALGDSLWRR